MAVLFALKQRESLAGGGFGVNLPERVALARATSDQAAEDGQHVRTGVLCKPAICALSALAWMGRPLARARRQSSASRR